MILRDLLEILPDKEVSGSVDIDVSAISYDSRRILPGSLFVGVSGFVRDGSEFAGDAIDSGALAVVVQKNVEVDPSITKIVVPNTRQALALLANKFYDFPSKKLKIIGVTGTKGKTTIAYLIDAILRKAGLNTGIIGTVEAKIGDMMIPARLTTPESLDLQWMLYRMAESEVQYVIMEVTSHALALGRVDGVEFDLAIYSNIAHEHLDFHKTMDAYKAAKLRLFQLLQNNSKGESIGIVNVDDHFSSAVKESVHGKIVTYGIDNPADVSAGEIYNIGLSKTTFNLVTAKGTELMGTSLVGNYNVSNILAAAACGYALGIDTRIIRDALEDMACVPGRFEKIDCDQEFNCIIDFAHSPDSLEKLLSIVKNSTKGRLILVFGCPGGHDRIKRLMLGEVAARYADFAIITTDNPQNEDPERIIDEIELGMIKSGGIEGKTYLKIEGRRTAIKQALSTARLDDTVLITGRGHEKYQDFKGMKVEIDDRDVVRSFLANAHPSD